MKFICLGCLNEEQWTGMPKSEQEALLENCIAHDDALRESGILLVGEGLQSVRTAKTLLWKNGEVLVTDGPFAETKEHIGGLWVLEARDMKHAIEVMSKHPAVRLGWPFEIRPVEDLKGIIREIRERRQLTK